MDNEAAGFDLIFRDTFARRTLSAHCAIPAHSQCEKSAVLRWKVRDRADKHAPLRLQQPAAGFQKLRCKLHHIIKRCALRFALFHFRIACGHRHASHVSDALHCFRKACAFQLGQKFEVIAGYSATETVVTSLTVFAVEAWRFSPWNGQQPQKSPFGGLLFFRSNETRVPISVEIGTRSRISSRKEGGKRITIVSFSSAGNLFFSIYRRARTRSP